MAQATFINKFVNEQGRVEHVLHHVTNLEDYETAENDYQCRVLVEGIQEEKDFMAALLKAAANRVQRIPRGSVCRPGVGTAYKKQENNCQLT